MMFPSRRRVGWGLFGPCKPRVLANGFNSSDIVCDSATDLNLSPVPGCLGRFTPSLRIREPGQSEARKVPGFSGISYVGSLQYFFLVLQKISFDTKGNLQVM
jgi:hypothetical protein